MPGFPGIATALSSISPDESQSASTQLRVVGGIPSWGLGLVAAILWLLPSVGQLDKYLGAIGAGTVALLVLASLPIGFVWLAGKPPIDDRIAALLTHLIVLFLVVSFAALYPLVLTHVVGGGSDREDALNVALKALSQGRYPYSERTFLGTPFSPLPGALLLALPAWLFGRSGFQNLFWVPGFVYFSRRLFASRETQILFAAIFLLTCPGAMQDFVTGGDYLINCLYVVVAIELAASAYERSTDSLRMRVATCVFLSVCLSSRQNYAVAVPVLSAFLFQKAGFRRMLEFLLGTALCCAAINLPFYFYSPAEFPLFNQGMKFDGIPEWLHAAFVFPLVAMAIATASFFIVMNRERLYGIIALSFLPLFVLPLALWFGRYGPLGWVLAKSGYSLPLTIFGGLWLLTMWRAPGEPAKAANEATDRETEGLAARG